MTESELRTPSNKYNQATMQRQLFHEEYNSVYNHHVLVEAFDSGRARDLNDEPKMGRAPCIVIGSGPSLDLALPHMAAWEGGIICTTSQARTLMYHGVEPTHIVALDPFSQWTEIEGVDWSKTRTKLVLNPGVWPDLVANWPNDMLLYRSNLGKRNTFYAQQQNRMYSRREGERDATFHYLIRTEVTLFACSPPAELFVADRLEYGHIFLSGCDFAYSNGKERFTEWKPGATPDDPWTEDRRPMKADYSDQPKAHTAANGTVTHEIHLYYKKNMVTAWRLSHQTVYTTDENGNMRDVMDYAPMAEVVAKQGRDYTEHGEGYVESCTEPYLASIGCFVVVGPNGYAFVESEQPLIELEDYCRAMRRNYACNNCGWQVHFKDNDSHAGDRCKKCDQGTYQIVSDIDIDANMARIKKLVAANPERYTKIVDGQVTTKKSQDARTP